MDKSNLKIIFLGTPEIAATILKRMLADGFVFDAVVTLPDKPQGRGQGLGKSPVKILAQEKSIQVFQPKTKLELEEIIKAEKPDLIILVAYGAFLTDPVLKAPKYGAINLHPSLLPLYRGPAPISGPILSGDAKTGVTVMLMNEKMDEGDILAQKEIELTSKETSETLSKKLAELGAELLIETVPKCVMSEVQPRTQDHTKATYTKMIKKEDGKIDWQKETAKEIERKSRAFQPWPGVYTHWRGKKIDLFELEIVKNKLPPGEFMVEDGLLRIGTKTTAISPRFVKVQGKNKISSQQFIHGYGEYFKK